MAPKKLIVGCDHGAFALKQALLPYLASAHADVDVEDVGSYDDSRVDYPDIAAKVCTKVLAQEGSLGLVLCGTGIGISIAANKFNGIRCALAHDHYTALMSREHNNANVLSIGGRVTGIEVAKDILTTFLTNDLAEGNHAGRIEKIHALEQK